jgi:hypothetical protein
LHVGGQRRELRLRLIEGEAVFQASHDAQVVVVESVWPARLQIERRPHVDVRLERIVEVVREHGQDAMRNAVERQQLSGRVGSRVEVLAPDPFAYYRHVGIGPLVGAIERLTKGGADAQDAKVVGADQQGPDALRLGPIREVGADDAVRIRHRDIECLAVVPVIDRRQTREVAVIVAAAVIDADEPFRIVVGKRLEDHSVQDAEHRGVGASAEREGDDHDGGESRGR